ncbi:hypothetical protein HanRHA438_Chr08g0351811 [Helianthus annuus]|nr:hypothetical protein HanHA300_Chr08g0281281 [Helianthus annuus]KAJ0553632.1 hypothetical protein HanHA89_Chr08g0298521 [Helianthus annuus]KAJ0719294.1 hypothetical protein HanLR1_Chr08g0280071 [Helianthus annuus]KAJ0722527.1 hypothetical protein HanOQP8_Chr08g0287611 [Helianthus annuus]KAJ0897994.1 hypothetical protein HanRHA438_Chr08g0351811 [Helianthus annuus]
MAPDDKGYTLTKLQSPIENPGASTSKSRSLLTFRRRSLQRRESAHGESVCCNNVRALFDELPTPHLVVEVSPFPAGPLTESDYARAEKLERVLRSGPSV